MTPGSFTSICSVMAKRLRATSWEMAPVPAIWPLLERAIVRPSGSTIFNMDLSHESHYSYILRTYRITYRHGRHGVGRAITSYLQTFRLRCLQYHEWQLADTPLILP